ncbi:MAG TPA: KH domain-containing protein [Clostridiales bacterium]|nr:KH domain-containing protein [Clostridiales bacterium]
MIDLLDFIMKNLACEDSYEIVESETPYSCNIDVFVDKDKIAKVIGYHGKTAKAIKTLVKAANKDNNKKCDIYIKER